MREAWARGPFGVDYEHRLDFPALRSGRLARARLAMAEAGLDALLVWKDENVRYLTSLRPQLIAGKSGLLNGALLTADEVVLFISGGDFQRARDTMPWVAEFHPIPILEEAGLVGYFVDRVLRPLLQRKGLGRGRVGTDLASFALHEALRERLPQVRWSDGDRVMHRARRVKLPEEVALLEEATAMAEAVTQVALDAIRPGVREVEVAAEALRALYRLGGEYPHVTTPFVASGERMSPPTRLSTDKLIRHGDLVFVDIGCMWNGYFADVGRTVICGDPSADQRRVYRAVLDAHRAGLEAMRPGATNREVADRIRAEARRHGLEEHFLSLFIGHGIGVGSNEPPYVGEVFPDAEEVVLEPGMVFALEPLIWLPGVRGGGGVRLEDMVLVTESGPRVLSRLPYDSRLLG
jgi:Xaa-Pro aminopeptidase